MTKKLDGEVVRNEFLKRGYIPQFTSSDYKDNNTKLPYICPKHPNTIQYIVYNSLKSGRGCKLCANETISKKKQPTIDAVYQRFIDKGYEPLFSPDEYKKGKKLPFRCLKHPEEIQAITYPMLKYSGCKFCGLERQGNARRQDGHFIIQTFIDNNFTPLFNPEDYINSQQKLPCICNKHPDNGIIKIKYAQARLGQGCKQCHLDKVSGSNCYNYKGGTSPLATILRERIADWKYESAKNCNFKCVISGEKFGEIHHLVSFADILKDVMRDLNMNVSIEVGMYTDEEINRIVNALKSEHNKYPLGVCLRTDIHHLFHSIYGKGNNTPEQFEEFRQRWLQGEFDVAEDVGEIANG